MKSGTIALLLGVLIEQRVAERAEQQLVDAPWRSSCSSSSRRVTSFAGRRLPRLRVEAPVDVDRVVGGAHRARRFEHLQVARPVADGGRDDVADVEDRAPLPFFLADFTQKELTSGLPLAIDRVTLPVAGPPPPLGRVTKIADVARLRRRRRRERPST